jgi:hypothetical protein
MKRILTVAAFALSLNACVTVESTSLTRVPRPKDRKNIITAEASKFLIFNIAGDTDYVAEVTESLRDQCKAGRVMGILTKDLQTNYFIGIVMKRTVHAQGYCVKGEEA